MGSHLSAIGFGCQQDSDVLDLVERIWPNTTEHTFRGGCYRRWDSGCGADVWLHLDRQGVIVGLTPGFAGKGSLPFRAYTRFPRERGTRFEGALKGWTTCHTSGTDVHPIAFDLIGYGLPLASRTPFVSSVRLTAFAHDITTHSDAHTFLASQESKLKLASNFFIHTGLLDQPEDRTIRPASTAMFAAKVIESAEHVVPMFNSRFHWMLVESLIGTLDIVADPADTSHLPPPGSIVVGSFWLCGRLY
jgi:hypothetical protein